MGGGFRFEFRQSDVESALEGDEGAFRRLCEQLAVKYDALDRRIRSLRQSWSDYNRDAVFSAFVEKFVRVFRAPAPDLAESGEDGSGPGKVRVAIRDFNRFCGRLLVNCLIDEGRRITSGKRNQGLEVDLERLLEQDDVSTADCFSAVMTEAVARPVVGRSAGLSVDTSAYRLYATAEDMYSAVDMDSKRRLVARILRGLPEKKRRVILMWMNRIPSATIAARVGTSPGNVDCMISRTLKDLRTWDEVKNFCKE